MSVVVLSCRNITEVGLFYLFVYTWKLGVTT